VPLSIIQQARLRTALDHLPKDLTFLRLSILAIAKQDEDLLGCGEAETSTLVKALRKQADGASMGELARALAESLHSWIKEQAGHDEPWAGPIWFVEGTLRGCEMFGIDDALPPPPKPALGLQKTELEIPLGMKTKLYASGLELKNSEVQIIIGEVDEATYRGKLEAYAKYPPQNLPSPPHPREERDTQFRIGDAQGIKVTYINAGSGLPVMCNYELRLHEVFLMVGLFARKERGLDLRKYEPLIATIRCK
jgi:hypothetical protein